MFVQFVKDFKKIIPELIQIMIIGVIVALFVVFQVMNVTRLLPIIGGLLASLSIAFIVIYLALKKSFLLAYIIIFMVGFANGLRSFFITITSFWMNGFAFFGTFDIQVILSLLICLYLMLMILSHVIQTEFSFKLPKMKMCLVLLLFIGFIYFNHGFGTVVYAGLILLALLNQDKFILPLLFMFYYIINLPLGAIDQIIQGTAEFTSLHYWFMTVFAIVVGTFIVLAFLKSEKPVKKEA